MKVTKVDLEQTTQDGFLGGRVNLLQPKNGFRSSMDAVLLAAAIPAQKTQKILELGCGVGAVLMCLGARISNLKLNGVEIQELYADLAEKNATINSKANIYCADIQNLPQELQEQSFDHVISNPPFYYNNMGTHSKNIGKNISLREQLNLAEWVKISSKRLKQGGMATLLIGAERLPDILSESTKYFGNIKIKPICSRHKSDANRIIIQMKKGSKSTFSLLPPLVVHKEQLHETDSKDFTEIATNILENGHPIII
jgi:tRNA1Val (adenine37-N6)-methyltransferase